MQFGTGREVRRPGDPGDPASHNNRMSGGSFNKSAVERDGFGSSGSSGG
ncbi:hypothetical protein [Streptomyces sp. NRRL S-15]